VPHFLLRAALPLAAYERNSTLLGPEVVTAPTLLRPPASPDIATPFQVLLAWSATLRAASPETASAFLGSERPDSIAWALPLARRLHALRTELADGALSIGDVPVKGADVCPEIDRWEAMQDLEGSYHQRLNAWGVRDPIAAQLEYAQEPGPKLKYQHIVLAAVPDPPQLLLRLLERWSELGAVVDILVAAPPDEAGAFDEWGRPDVGVWARDRQISIEDENIVLCANPEDEAARVAGLLKEGSNSAGRAPENGQRPDVAIGVPDAETVHPLQRELAAIGFEAFDPRNRPLQEMPVFGLVQSLMAWQRSGSAQETAQLLRHPDILAATHNATAMLKALDKLNETYLPVTFDHLQALAKGDAVLTAALDQLANWRKQLSEVGLAAGLRTSLQDIYGKRMLSADQPRDMRFRQAVTALDEALRELSAAEKAGQGGSDADAVFMARLQDASIKPEREGEPLDLEGWLELGWNPSPLMFVCGMNEGMVPDSKLGDLFLPDSLRRQLALRDDRQRTARDAYLLAAMLEQRKKDGRLVLLTGKTSLAGDPLKPSRLLFRCPDTGLVDRARKLSAHPPAAHLAATFGRSFQLAPFDVPDKADRLARLLERGISATKFKDYLTCPLRFYFKHVLGMQTVDDRAREPDYLAFGNMVHNTLDAMASSPERIWACGDSVKLADWLEEDLRRQACAMYGNNPWLGFSAVVESAARRLRAFAEKQTEWYHDGWDIIENENEDYRFELDGIPVTGRIDRIDRNRNDGSICVLDYKTTDTANPPIKTHLASQGHWDLLPAALIGPAVEGARGAQRWQDLQLPLYRELVRARHGDGASIGYVLLPMTAAETSFSIWDSYTTTLHESAIACATAVVQGIRDERFWPPAPGKVTYDDYGELLFDDALEFIVPPGAAEEVSS
jgi:ATP-dependent helicase/nuclease subunit B